MNGGTSIRELTRGLATLTPKGGSTVSVKRQGWNWTPKKTVWQCTPSMCVAGVHCWEISLGLADPWNVCPVDLS